MVQKFPERTLRFSRRKDAESMLLRANRHHFDVNPIEISLYK